MKHTFQNKRISAILSVLPPTIARYADELEDYNFPVRQSEMLGKMMDYRTRREVGKDEALSEYALYGIEHLLAKGVLRKEEIEGIIVVSSSQDYIMPSASYILQGKLGLSEDTYVCDIINACGGYVNGLMQSFMVMDTMGLKKVLLVTGDTLTKKIGKRDRNARPIIGDAVNISVVEQYAEGGKIYAEFRNSGDMADAIKIPAGGMKQPSSPETAIEEKDASGNFRAPDHFYMDGEGVFNYVMTHVPPMIESILKESGDTIESVDYYMFHQPNKYMVDRLADELEIPNEKCFSNIVGEYGNASTGTIALNICHNIAEVVKSRALRLCLSGFGAGLTCNAMVFTNPRMEYCAIIDYKRI